MGFRDRVRAVFGPNPADVNAAIADAGMDNARAFGPGRPQDPYAGYGTTPRTRDFPAGSNIIGRPRHHERVSFHTLRALIDSYDVAQLAISHTIDDVRSMTYTVKAAPWARGDVDAALDKARKVLRRPDGVLPFTSWLAAYLNDVLRYDAGSLYKVRNRRGDAIGLRVLDGSTIAPLIDDYGNRPQDPAPAFVQYAQGTPWDWLSADDLIYVPFRPRSDSSYGLAPMEMVLLNANTDLRFQQFFLRRFTEGTIPEGLALAPDAWTPDQIEQFQQIWDDLLYGDESAKHQLKFVPPLKGVEWHKAETFDVELAKYLERKTLVAFGRVPADMGITDDVNRSTGDTQADVQFRIGTLPLVRFVEAVLDGFLQDDLGLPVIGEFDTGQETEDRLATAQADDLYIKNGTLSPDEIREMRFGKPVDSARPLGRFVFGQRPGPIPLAAIDAVAGPIDPETYAPTADAELPKQVFAPIEGVAPAKPPSQPPLAVERFGDAAAPQGDVAAVTKAETEGVTSDTGIFGDGLIHDDSDLVSLVPDDLVKAELSTFHRFAKARRRQREWRDFTFTRLSAVQAHRLNDSGRAQVRKASGELIAAGLAVKAADTGRVLMLQRAFDETDDAGGAWEMPGGHIETGETPLGAAMREWQEETGILLPTGDVTGTWTSDNGVYQGFVYTVPSEASLPILDRDEVNNPDDPDGDLIEALAWWTPEHLADNPAIRDELALDVPKVLAALTAPVVKAGGDGPKGWHAHPARDLTDRAATYHAEKIQAALTATFPRERLAALTADYLRTRRAT